MKHGIKRTNWAVGFAVVMLFCFTVILSLPKDAYAAGAVELPKTGQTTSYFTGDDGDLRIGVAWPDPRFTVEADCVTDNLTGLMWVREPERITLTWEDALTYANKLTLCGYSDWRLPNRKELRSLINYGEANTATWLNAQGFSNVQPNWYWSSTTSASYTDGAWVVDMWGGYVEFDPKVNKYLVWPVRAGQ